MKKITLYIVLISYSMLLLKPVLPLVNDWIAHVFFYAHHMATMHYENGKYHVHYEMAKDAKEEKSDKNNTASKKENEVTEHMISLFVQPGLSLNSLINKFFLPVTPAVISGNVQVNYPPPRV